MEGSTASCQYNFILSPSFHARVGILAALLSNLSSITVSRIPHKNLRSCFLNYVNSSLFEFQQADCAVPETIDHYFFECGKFPNQRDTLERKLNEINITILSLETLLSDLRTKSKFLFYNKFIMSSKRFVYVGT